MIRVAAVLLLAASLNARADWQWSKWGMTPDQVIAASSGSARMANEEERRGKSVSHGPRDNAKLVQDAVVIGTYTAAGMTFNTAFMFDPRSQRLICVRLNPPVDASFHDLRDKLTDVYGQPSEEKHDPGTVTFRRAVWLKQDRIELASVTIADKPSAMYLSYCQRGKDAKGL